VVAVLQSSSFAGVAAVIFEHAVDGMLVLDGGLTVRALNPAAERLLCWAAADVVGGLECRQLLSCRRDSPWFLGDDAHGECLCAAALHRAVPEADLLIRPRPGQSRLVSASGSPLALGHDRGALLVLRPLSGARPAQRLELHVGSLRLDLGRHEVRVGAQRVHLTPIEFALLRYLLVNRERVVPRQELLENVWKYHCDDGSDVVKVHIGSLRHALKAAGVSGLRIANVYGVGYMLTAQT
jgi:DNA-binding winged helix-turn-helix (wHTH) protein